MRILEVRTTVCSRSLKYFWLSMQFCVVNHSIGSRNGYYFFQICNMQSDQVTVMILFFFSSYSCFMSGLRLGNKCFLIFLHLLAVSKMFDIFFHFSYSDFLRRVLWVKRCFCRRKRFVKCNRCWQWFPAKWNRENSAVLQDF